MKVTGLVFLALCVLYATADINTRIVGGKDAEEGQFPYQVSLRNIFRRSHFCGGSILSSRFILTAAHCTQEINSIPMFVYAVVGTLNSIEGGVVVFIDKITPHEAFTTEKLEGDISLLRTTQEIVFTNLIQPIALPTHDTEKSTGAILSGWGKTIHPSQQPLPALLQFTRLQTIDTGKCREEIENQPEEPEAPVHDSNLCTTSAIGIGACFGDSGGPLVDISNPETKTLVGIVSWGVPCGIGYPDVFTRVYSFLDWIEQKIAAQCQDL